MVEEAGVGTGADQGAFFCVDAPPCEVPGATPPVFAIEAFAAATFAGTEAGAGAFDAPAAGAAATGADDPAI